MVEERRKEGKGGRDKTGDTCIPAIFQIFSTSAGVVGGNANTPLLILILLSADHGRASSVSKREAQRRETEKCGPGILQQRLGLQDWRVAEKYAVPLSLPIFLRRRRRGGERPSTTGTPPSQTGLHVGGKRERERDPCVSMSLGESAMGVLRFVGFCRTRNLQDSNPGLKKLKKYTRTPPDQ